MIIKKKENGISTNEIEIFQGIATIQEMLGGYQTGSGFRYD